MKLYEILFEGTEFNIVGKAANGLIALDKLKRLSEMPDIVIMDYRMPIMKGIEATIEILKMECQTKIIFATADDEIKEKALKVGAISIINKPFNLEELLLTIKNSLKGKLKEV